MTPSRLQEHIERLCDAHSIEWNQGCPIDSARALLDEKTIECPPIHGRLQYFTALHEIAHLVLGPSYENDGFDVVTHEAECWQWALKIALVGPNQMVAADIRRGLHSYADSVYEELNGECPFAGRWGEDVEDAVFEIEDGDTIIQFTLA